MRTRLLTLFLQWAVLPAMVLAILGGALLGRLPVLLTAVVFGLTGGLFLFAFLLVDRQDAARARALRAGRGVLARWAVDSRVWHQHTAARWEQSKRQARRRSLLWGACLAAALVLLSLQEIDLLRTQLPILVYGFCLGAAAGLACSAVPLARAWASHRPQGEMAEVIIGETGLLWQHSFYGWEGGRTLEAVVFEPGENPALRFVIRPLPGHDLPTAVRVPVPPERAAEAAAIARRLSP